MSKILKHSNQNIPHSEREKERIIKKATIAYGKYMDALGFDWKNDPNAHDTPRRVAKAMVNDLISGCYTNPPSITSFPSDYTGIVFEGNIPLISMCAHHHQTIEGVCHIAYVAQRNVIGLSKLNRIVEHYGRRPQIQEDIVSQIHSAVNKACTDNRGVAVLVSAKHNCVSCRGVKHQGCLTKTSVLSGDFMDDPATRSEFYEFINQLKMGQ